MNLSGEHSRLFESLAEQIDLGDHAAVWHHHRDWPEHGFQIIGKFGATRVTRIHRDEDAAGVHQQCFSALEYESGEPL